LAVSTPKHLHTIGLLDSPSVSEQEELNFLMETALAKIAFIPFGYLMDKYRWNIFRGVINESNYNEKWWEMK
jgi:peptidyl-dipeptidase A